jgi:hypothetical protein
LIEKTSELGVCTADAGFVSDLTCPGKACQFGGDLAEVFGERQIIHTINLMDSTIARSVANHIFLNHIF